MAFLRKIPDKVAVKLKSISSPAVLVACAVELTEADIDDLGLSKLGIKVESEEITIPAEPVFPDSSFGQVSDENINGREIVDRKADKITKEIYLGARPVYGDWSNGSFSLWQTREVYQKSFIQPRGFSLRCTLQGIDALNDKWKLTFAIEPGLDKNNSSFGSDLIFALSLLREVTGKYDVFPADITASEIASTMIVSWEIFPPGQRDLKTEVARRLQKTDEKTRKVILDRAGTIESLNPVQYVLGSGLASNYYGALFADDLVVFENLEYGNATYILYEDWQKLSKLSRTELLNGQQNFDRIIHGANWADNVTEVVKHETWKRKYQKQ